MLVVDAEGRESLDAGGHRDDRLLCTFEPSPAWKIRTRDRCPDGEIASFVPHHDGPWHAAVERDLEALGGAGVASADVPLLDCFRSVWREQLTALRALEHGLAGERRPFVTPGGPSPELLLGAAQGGDLEAVHVLPGPPGAHAAGVLVKMRRAGARGLAMALASRLDPAGDRRARFRRPPRVPGASTLLVSSYVNPTRAALEALGAVGGGPAILLTTGPGATRGLRLPPDLVCMPLHAALALDRRRARRLRASAVPAALAALRTWNAASPGWKPWTSLQRTQFGRQLAGVHLPEVLSVIVAVRALVAASGARTLIVGDEFSFGDRAALHAARQMGLSTISRQHGVLDSHYIRDRILADRHFAWNQATVRWLEAHDALGATTAEVHPRGPQPPLRRIGRADSIVVFLQPTNIARVPFDDWLGDTLPAVLRAAEALGLRVILKAHPLQSGAEVRESIPPELRDRVRLVSGTPAAALLTDAAAAVVLDSSVCLDATEAGVPCLSTAWYHTPYGSDLARLGYVSPCATPAELEASLRVRARQAGST